MKPTRIATLVAVAIAVGLACWIVVRLTYPALPPLPWTAVVTLVVVAVVELLLARGAYTRIRRRAGAPLLEPLVIARYLVLAKATAYVAAIVAGAFGGLLGYLLGNLSAPTQRTDAWVAAACTLGAVVLGVAAMLLEYACRVPGGSDGDEESTPTADRQ